MSVEQYQQTEKALDAEWFDRYADLTLEAFSLLDGNGLVRAAEKERFLAGSEGNPHLDYPQLHTVDFGTHEKALLVLKADVLARESNEVVREIYRTKINETIAELRMLRCAHEGDDRRFSQYSAFVYGRPMAENTEIMTQIVQEKVSRGSTAVKKDAATKLRPVFETFVPALPERQLPLVSVESSVTRVESIDEVVSACKEALLDIGADDSWQAVVDSTTGITNFRVSQRDKQVRIPSEEVVGMLVQQMRSFVQHEIYGHVQRRIAGEQSTLKLLAIGLDRYEKGEEGVATHLEQLEKGADSFSHPERYFAIALARGDVDGVKRDFRQTFEVLVQYYIAVLASKKTGPSLEERAADWAWRLSVRTFRGTTGNTPGAVFTKDLNYFVGNKETWALVNTDENVVQYFTIGKFDAANARHVAWLLKLGITDERLQEIQNETFGVQ